ncbi:MAG: pyridine nucleotide-disulfide oxidoreductase [Burkholderiales bacterium 70-64]|nr:MAG: pyridine nucleotide-disulfide oxidoreductase [Burkholderiales bacterium 70-64]
MTAELALAWGLRLEDLYSSEGLAHVDATFVARLRRSDAALAQRLLEARRQAAAEPPAEGASGARSDAALLTELGPHVDAFVARLFGIVDDLATLREAHRTLDPLYEVKRQFVKRQAAKLPPAELAGFDAGAALREIESRLGRPFEELAFARAVLAWQRIEADETADAGEREAARARLALALRYCAWAVASEEGRRRHAGGVLFRQPAKVDPQRLLGHAREHDEHGVRVFTIDPQRLRRREGFALTDDGTDLRGALDEANYCIWCHEQGKDSCSKGLKEKPGPTGEAAWKRSPFGVNLAGCPLEERISEFHLLKTQGHAIAALAMITVDNPMLAATGHRICNDCMKACIYQKQTPVDIPQAETRTLKDVLELPWGFEIYSLLTRWNPLNLRRPVPRPDSGYRVLVAGMGPAGFTLAHHLMNEGHGVVGIDGLKIEPLDEALSGVRADGSRVPFEPVHDVRTLYEPLGERVMAGFGGVAEYGITVRWNKNFLKLVRLLLVRRERFSLVGGVRFGSTLDVDDALALGFDHVALAMGAGRPTTLDIPNGLARGVRTASDFLMALQLTGAARVDSLANMQLRLPVVVIGGGLTAIDTATESLAYYTVQVEKFLARHEALAARLGEAGARAGWNAEDAAIAEEFIAHARAIRAEREAARREQRAPRLAELLQRWGGVTIAYRKRLVDSPSYTLNHEEVEKALEEGIRYAECLAPTRIDVDAHGAVESITFARQHRDEQGGWSEGEPWRAPARTVFVAAGTQPNTVLAREDPTHFALDGRYFRAVDAEGRPVAPVRANAKPDAAQVLLARLDDGRMLSFFGDLHPSYFGNVVKAMASARHGYPVVCRMLGTRPPACGEAFDAFARRLDALLRPRIERVERLTPTIIEVVVHAPMAARRFRPGQFYRLQNFESRAPRAQVDGRSTTLAMEGLALTGAWVDRERGLVSTIVLEMGGSSNLCADLAPGEPVVLMGPTGSPTGIASGETVVLVGGGLGNAVLFSIGAALRAAGSRVLYFAGYKKRIDRYKVAEIEAAADTIVWCCDEAPGFEPGRAQDRSVVGNIVDAMAAYARGELSDLSVEGALRLQDADRIIAIGSDRMMAAVAAARHAVLAPYLKPCHRAIGSINSPMQCMMKEICAQCLQPHKDPESGKVSYVFSCFDQDQPLDQVDFPALGQRLAQNRLQERQTAAWIALCRSGARSPAQARPSARANP